MRILSVAGSIQARSTNRALLDLARTVAPTEVEVVDAGSLDRVPHYNADLDGEAPPEAVVAWRKALREADAVLIASPEYGHGVPGVLKNALDWIVGSGELVGKPVVATCAAQAKGRGLLGLASLVQTLRAIDAIVVWSHPVIVPRAGIDAGGQIVDPAVHREVRSLLERLIHAVTS
jgi:NAD(P)H-dependent FMN reductase